MYWDKLSKTTDDPCCHVELRYYGADACKLRDVAKATDLLTLDKEKCFERDICLSIIDWKKADQLLMRDLDIQINRSKKPVAWVTQREIALRERTCSTGDCLIPWEERHHHYPLQELLQLLKCCGYIRPRPDKVLEWLSERLPFHVLIKDEGLEFGDYGLSPMTYRA